MIYCIITKSFSDGLQASEISSILARELRTSVPGILTDQILQLPVPDGGEGMIETLVTLLLGSFLEVEVTGIFGDQIVTPIGFIGENNNIALIEVRKFAEASGTTGTPETGTTFGLGELVQDALDEGAFSIVLGADSALPPDAGLGFVAALGVKFFDASGNAIDLQKPQMNLFERIDKIDATARPFEALSARFFLTKPASMSGDDTRRDPLLEGLARLNKLIERDCGKAVDMTGINGEFGAMEFGLRAFFNVELQEPSSLILDASGMIGKLREAGQARVLLVTDTIEEAVRAPEASAISKILATASDLGTPVLVVTNHTVQDSKVAATAKKKFEKVFALPDVALFQAPLSSSASKQERSRDQKMRLEKLAPKLFGSV